MSRQKSANNFFRFKHLYQLNSSNFAKKKWNATSYICLKNGNIDVFITIQRLVQQLDDSFELGPIAQNYQHIQRVDQSERKAVSKLNF